ARKSRCCVSNSPNCSRSTLQRSSARWSGGLQRVDAPRIEKEETSMANTFGTDALIQSPDPEAAASFYVKNLGFEISDETLDLISLHGTNINLFIERGPDLGPVLEVTVANVDEAKRRLVQAGCTIVKDEPAFPRCYVRDPFGLVYNLRA